MDDEIYSGEIKKISLCSRFNNKYADGNTEASNVQNEEWKSDETNLLRNNISALSTLSSSESEGIKNKNGLRTKSFLLYHVQVYEHYSLSNAYKI